MNDVPTMPRWFWLLPALAAALWWPLWPYYASDDFIAVGPEGNLESTKKTLEEVYKLKTEILGRGEGLSSEIRVLNKSVRLTESGVELEAEPRLGSFRCPACGAQNDASAEDCTNCGTPRGDAPRGSLSLALRTSKLDVEQCGFEPAAG